MNGTNEKKISQIFGFRNSAGAFVAPVLFFFFNFHANFGHFIADYCDLLAVGGADGWSWSVGWAEGRTGGVKEGGRGEEGLASLLLQDC